jgi:hypothetical protein
MGIDIHAFNFIRMQSMKNGLGSTLTIGRQSLNVTSEFIRKQLNTEIGNGDGYCELLLKKLNATDVCSIDYSDYEKPTYIGDLNLPIDLPKEFDTVIDAGSLEHVFDTACAFKNLIKCCKVGGQIIHILPVNNLSGHGFWQFSSDLMFSIYSSENGFSNTEVYYASGLDFSTWYKVPGIKPGTRVQLVSLEPILLLCVAKKIEVVDSIKAVQPYYLNAWAAHDVAALQNQKSVSKIWTFAKRRLRQRGSFVNLLRNAALILGLVLGRSSYSIKSPRFKKVVVKDQFQGERE